MKALHIINLCLGLGLSMGCVEARQYEHEHADLVSGAADSVGQKRSEAACRQRWQAPTHVHDARSVEHSRAGARCAGRAQSGAVKLGAFIREHFGRSMDLRVPGNGVQIYNCRTVRGGRSRSVHGDGRAVDIFIPTLPGGVADNEKGDPIANWLVANADYIGIQYIIWDRTSFKGNRNTQSQCYTGTHPHNDHIHLELSWAAAREETPFFVDSTPTPEPMSSRPVDRPNPPNDTPPIPPPEPERPTDLSADEPYSSSTAIAWLGEPCDTDAHCIQTQEVPATCVVPNGARSGFCTVSCDGLCPDKSGHSNTFCATANMIGMGTVGLCMAKAQAMNGYCGQWPDFEPFDGQRYLSTSTARRHSAVICAAMPPHSVVTEDHHPSDVDTFCDDPTLPPSDHGADCTGVRENTWRCACSQRFETPVSQVCRDGSWINYDLNPRDCSQCRGAYSSACEP